MKILHVINSLGTGGAEKLVADLAPLQRDAGTAVEVLLLKGGATPFRESLERAGIRVHDFGAGTSVYSPMNIFRLIPFLRKYDVVHVHLFPAQYWVALAKAISFAGTPLVTTEHSVNNRRRKSAFWRIFDKIIYCRYSKVVCCAPAAEKTLAIHLRTKENIMTISNGVDVSGIFSAPIGARGQAGISNQNFLLLQVARFNYPKDQKTVIRALFFLPNSVHAVFVGDGNLRAECERLAEEAGVSARVHFLGIRRDVPMLLKMADVVICSSAYEGLSLASAEGLAAGKPVVASDVPGLAEVVGGAGLLFPQGDEKALAGTIEKTRLGQGFLRPRLRRLSPPRGGLRRPQNRRRLSAALRGREKSRPRNIILRKNARYGECTA